jgi:hypothetical protein
VLDISENDLPTAQRQWLLWCWWLIRKQIHHYWTIRRGSQECWSKKNLQIVTVILHGYGLLDSMFIELCRDGYPINEKHNKTELSYCHIPWEYVSRLQPLNSGQTKRAPSGTMEHARRVVQAACWNPSGHLKPQNHPKLYPNLLLAVISNHSGSLQNLSLTMIPW